MIEVPLMIYCKRCLYPQVAATSLILDEDGVCSGCRTREEMASIDWDARKARLLKLLEPYRNKADYDVVIPVSGGKDSFFQTHFLKYELGLKPLLITYNENNETPVGRRNIQRMKEVFNVDYINMTPSIDVLRKLNRIGFREMGDPDMQAHFGIFTVPIRMAMEKGVQIFVYGEHGFMDLGGMHSYHDLVEFTGKFRREHNLRGYDWQDFVGKEGLTERDLAWMKYPTDSELAASGLRGLFLSNYTGWRQTEQTNLMIEKYGFEFYDRPFARTWTRDTALNNFHDHGLHDYMKFIKWGYGRATDHAARRLRDGAITISEAVYRIRNWDHAEPDDIPDWLDYTGLSRTEYENIRDSYRDPRVWVRDPFGGWHKDNVWDFLKRKGVEFDENWKPAPNMMGRSLIDRM